MGTHPIFESDFDCLTVIRTDFGWEYEVPVCLQRLKINVSKLKSHFERCNSVLLCSVRLTNLKFKPSAQPQPTQIQVQLIYDALTRVGKLQNRVFVLSLA